MGRVLRREGRTRSGSARYVAAVRSRPVARLRRPYRFAPPSRPATMGRDPAMETGAREAR